MGNNANLKMTPSVLVVAFSRGKAEKSVKSLGKKRQFRFEIPRHDSRSQWREGAPFRRLPLFGLRSIPRFYSIIGRPIQSLLSQRTAKSGCLSPCKRAKAS